MTNYIPFLKSKSNEIIALSELESEVLNQITPFFDYPRRNDEEDEEKFEKTVGKLLRCFKRHLSSLSEMYFDCYDLNDDLYITGKHVYHYLLEELQELPIIPVVSIDRSKDHQEAVLHLKSSGNIISNCVAFRVTSEDFQSYEAVSDDIQEELSDVLNAFEFVDLIFDCRVCVNSDINKISSDICKFSQKFSSDFNVRRFVVTGSSIPASVADVLESNSEKYVERQELNIYSSVCENSGEHDFILGDYTIISPNYSEFEVPANQMQNRTTAKLIYSFDNQHYFIRGGSLRTKGLAQYFDLAATLCGKDFFRTRTYSEGDKYFEEKSQKIGSNCMPGTIVKPSVNAHVTYVVRELV